MALKENSYHQTAFHHLHLEAIGAPTMDVPVQYADQASRAFSKYRDEFGFGASEMGRRCGNIYDNENRLIGRISYNGRIWDGSGKLIE